MEIVKEVKKIPHKNKRDIIAIYQDEKSTERN